MITYVCRLSGIERQASDTDVPPYLFAISVLDLDDEKSLQCYDSSVFRSETANAESNLYRLQVAANTRFPDRQHDDLCVVISKSDDMGYRADIEIIEETLRYSPAVYYDGNIPMLTDS